jgi:hypothetical protein
MTPEQSRAIWDRAVANRKVLDECQVPHDFVDVTPERNIGKDYRCSKCGGVVESLHRYWYEQGLKHGVVGASR